jgi:hypothetical protein
MTLEQLAWASGRHLDSVRKRLAPIIAQGLVQPLPKVLDGQMGRPQAVFAATEAALKWLGEHGCDRHLTLEIPAPRLHQHALLVNDLLTQLPRLTRALPEIQFRWAIPATPGGGKNRQQDGDNPALLVKGREIGHPGQRWWVPDAVLILHHRELGKTLLLYLEADCGTEAMVSNSADPSAIRDKLLAYREHLRQKAYQSLATAWQMEVNGFRLLMVTTSTQRLENLYAAAQQTQGCEFVWLTTQQDLRSRGLHERIWVPPGQVPPASILGSQYERAAIALSKTRGPAADTTGIQAVPTATSTPPATHAGGEPAARSNGALGEPAQS